MPDLSDHARRKVRAAAQDLRLWLLEADESAALAREAWLNEFDYPTAALEGAINRERERELERQEFDIDRDGPPPFKG